MIGDFAKTPRYQGAGSSLVNPTRQPESILDVIGDSGLVMTAYEQGYIRNRKPNAALAKSAVEAAKNADVVLVFAGLDEISESEGLDRTHMHMPQAQNELIDAITNLEMKGNKAALKSMLEKAAAILADTDAYVASTIDGLATVKADAQNVYDNADAVQSEINAAVKSLTLKIAAARLLGDVNGDGAVTTSDSVSVLAASAELTSLDADATASADVNGDGVADTLDAALILQTAAEK